MDKRRNVVHVIRAGNTSCLVAGVLAMLVVVVTTAGCSPGGPSLAEPSSVPPTTVSSDELTYEGGGQDYCEQVQFRAVAASFDLTPADVERGGTDTDPGSSSRPSRWVAQCHVTAAAEDGDLEQVGLFALTGTIEVWVYGDASDVNPNYDVRGASSHYRAALEELPDLLDDSIGPPVPDSGGASGWWDEGSYVEFLHFGAVGKVYALTYLVYQDNLFIDASLGVDFSEQSAELAVELAHDIARAFLDEAVAHIPPRR